MDNMITEDYISFEIAKLLNEKGFNELTPLSYSLPYGHESNIPCSNDVDTDFVSRITLQMAMKWLREVHNVNIWVEPKRYKEGLYSAHMKVGWCSDYWADTDYNTYEEACEAAIKYCLENVI